MIRRLAAMALIAGLAGCAGGRPTADALAEARTGMYVYHRPAAEVRAEVQALLREEGFTLVPTDDGPFVHTQWKRIFGDEDFATTSVRYVVLVKRLTAHHCRVEAMRLVRNTIGMETYHPQRPDNPSKGGNADTKVYGKGEVPLAAGPRTHTRDLALEWKLLQRLEPQRAHRIHEDAARAAASR